MRYRRIGYLYTEVVGALSGHFEAELRAFARPQAVASPLWRPHADVLETQDAYHVTLELPGVAEDEIDVAIFRDALVVSGRRQTHCLEGAIYHASEIRHGPFRFDMPLPTSVDEAKVEAQIDHGFLRIRLPKGPRAS